MQFAYSWMNQYRKAGVYRLFLLFFSSLLAGKVYATEIILSDTEDSRALRSFTQSLAEQRPQDTVRFVESKRLGDLSKLPPESRLILLGPQALAHRLKQKQGPPTLILRVSRVQAYSLLQNSHPDNISLLWSDPPLHRQLRLAHELLPRGRRIGALYSDQSVFLIEELQQAAKALGLQIIEQQWPEKRDNRPLQQLLTSSDLLIGLDDPKLFNPLTIKSLLLSSYAHQRALIGPTVGYVKAGSLASSYSDEADWLKTLNELLDQSPRNWPLGQYSRYFKVRGNPQVARALGIELASDEELTRRLTSGEPRP